MKYKGIIFDFNGTLFFDGKYHENAWNQMSMHLRNCSISKEEMHTKVHGSPNVQIIENLCPNQFNEEEKNNLSKEKETIYRNICETEDVHLVEGSKSFFAYAKEQGIVFNIASASIYDNIQFFFEIFHLDDYFCMKDTIYDNGKYVNKQNMFIDSLSILNVNKDDCIVIEDSCSGVFSAIQAGFKHIIVIYEDIISKELEGLEQVLCYAKDFNEVKEWFIMHNV